MQKALFQEMEKAESDPYDSHPSLKDRIAALEKLPTRPMLLEDPPAMALINHLSDLEKELFVALYGEEQGGKFQEISWKDTLDQVYLPNWRETVLEHGKALSGVRLGELPDLVENPKKLSTFFDFSQVSSSLFDFSQVTSLEEWEAPVGLIIGAAVTVALHRQGCQITYELGEPFKILIAGGWVAPFSLMADLHTGAMGRDHWKGLCSRAGLSDLDLGVLQERTGSSLPDAIKYHQDRPK